MMRSLPNLRFNRSAIWQWLTSDQLQHDPADREYERVDWLRCAPFIAMHIGCLAVLLVGVSPIAVAAAVLLFILRMFIVTAFYHRYFSHRTFKTSRPVQLIFAILGCTAGQRGPLWWAAHHRKHHNHADQEPDLHSPQIVGFLHAHMGWFMTTKGFQTDTRVIRDWMQYPELRWVNRLDWLPLLVLALLTWAAGALLERYAPSLGTTGWQMFVWAWLISTVALYHATYTINSLAHQFGSRRFDTGDDSRNNFWLALITLGEGWHNNHHHYPASARQGFYWWELDITYYGLLLLAKLRIIRDLRPVPPHVLERKRIDSLKKAAAT